MGVVALKVFEEEVAPLGSVWELLVVAVEATPFGEVIGYVEGGRTGCGVFVIDE